MVVPLSFVCCCLELGRFVKFFFGDGSGESLMATNKLYELYGIWWG